MRLGLISVRAAGFFNSVSPLIFIMEGNIVYCEVENGFYT